MKKIYNTTDYLYLDKDVMDAFAHAYNLGKSGKEVNMQKAYGRWRSGRKPELKKPTRDAILKAVSMVVSRSEENIADVLSGRGRMYVFPRQVFSWFVYHYTDATLENITEFLGYKGHAQVIHCIESVNSGMELYKDTRRVVDMVKSRLLYMGYELKRVKQPGEDKPGKIEEIIVEV
jgi:hypothetical protein